jgi:hypothetical protein
MDIPTIVLEKIFDRHSGAPRSGEPGIHIHRLWLWIPGLRVNARIPE